MVDAADSVTLVGRLGTSPELMLLPVGKMLILNLGVQLGSSRFGQNGLRAPAEKMRWHRVISFDPRVIARARGLTKDDTVAVRGHLERRTYESDNEPLYIVELVADNLDLIPLKRVGSEMDRGR